jgi:predicted acyltransferase
LIVGQNIINHIGALVIYVLIILSKLIVIEKDAKKPNVSIARNFSLTILTIFKVLMKIYVNCWMWVLHFRLIFWTVPF